MVIKVAKIQMVLLLTFAMMLNLALPAYAQAPANVQEFWGTVTVDGKAASEGAMVSVRTGGVQVGSDMVDAQGRYGFYSPLAVTAKTGALLEFYVNGVKAQQTATCELGKRTNLNLTVVSGSGAQPKQPSSSAPPTGSAAGFAISGLKAKPASVKSGETVTITADVKNSGGSQGTAKITVKVNGAIEIEQAVTLGPGRTQKVIFTLNKEQAGEYKVTMDGQSTSFKVSTSGAANKSWISWLTTLPWWMYVVIAIGLILVILVIIVLIQRRNMYY